MDIMPYCPAVFGFSSTLSFTIFTLSPSWPAISSSAGPIMRQGPHHSAQKSTTTGSADFKTSDSKLASDTLPTAMTTTSYVERGENRPRKLRGLETMNAVPQRQAVSRGGDPRRGLFQGTIQERFRKLHEIRDFRHTNAARTG